MACSEGKATTIKQSAYLYQSADDCHWTARTGPGDVHGRELRGVLATVDAGEKIVITGEDIGKSFMCWRVEWRDHTGYILASPDVATR
jgi:hypothetical protein